ncbi:ribonuclease R [Marinibactrum halimedae]|uniref:Ribonuclease R n=1 Tax=Marinibactrum halimedae TaxID=1444977 RepID=A0AA37WKM5_9GAMM|nr:ribonuclease R [Marinibactrum halimedae]MCD9460264.1 ribonuclease R [Marinibactrum halimedae]GLS24350.1 ribonuclease R [Marinibactrum halimedae]
MPRQKKGRETAQNNSTTKHTDPAEPSNTSSATHLKNDPHSQREAKNYANPIPSREYLLQLLEDAEGPVTHPEMCDLLGVTEEDPVEAVRRRLIAMARDGQIFSNRKGAFGAISKMDMVRGRIQGHKDGFGFLIPSDGSEDIYLPNRQMRRVMDGDEVYVQVSGRDPRGRKEGNVVEVIQHNTHQIVGRVFSESGIHFVRPDNPRLAHDVLIPPEKLADAKKGQFVVVAITQQPGRNNLPTGEIIEVMGDHMAPGMEIDVAIRSHGIPHLWPGDVTAQAGQLPTEVDESDKTHRVDLRELPFVTIDGEDARDFDDAVYCETKRSGGWRLYVAIADVSHYVPCHSPLDREAIERGNSVYFPDFVVPMLPEALSNGLCSLNPKVDRLCMVCEMTISAAGRISGYKFYEGIIHSHARLTYTKVGKIIEERDDINSGIRKNYASLLKPIDTLHDLYKTLRAARDTRGAIDFESVETRIIFDDSRKISRIVPVQRNDAHKLIEECMLAANVCAAKLLDKAEIDALYRVHEGPSDEKLDNLRQFLGEMGLSMRGRGTPTPAEYQTILQQIKDRPDAHLIQTVMLRSMSQAVYQPDNEGHFGLAYTAYTHFTSPIRRYPDLLVHRAIRFLLRGGEAAAPYAQKVARHLAPIENAPVLKKEAMYPYNTEAMLALGERCSLTERRADDATREVVSWLKCEFLSDRIGEEFDGVISSVTGFGVFVELSDYYVEGLIHVTNLPGDYYHFEPAKHHLIGEKTRTVYRLGDELRVQVASVNLDERKIDFELVGNKRKPRRTKVSAKARFMAEMHAEQQAKKSGRKSPRKRPVAEGKLARQQETSKPEKEETFTHPKKKPKKKSSNKKKMSAKFNKGPSTKKSASKKSEAKKVVSTKKKSTKKKKGNKKS